jgi:protease-4
VEAPQRLAAAGGDTARMALAEKLVDALKTRDELRVLMVERGAFDEEEKTFRQVAFAEYLAGIRPSLVGDAIGVVVAEGEIVDGQAPAGTVGGLSTANLIRKARDSKEVKAIVLRVNSPGGSTFGSELVRRELEVTRAAGKPVVVSMGDLAASGGYWIATASDEIVADPMTITGSIGVFALFPNVSKTLEKVGVHPSGVATTWLRNADDPRQPLDPRFVKLLQMSVDHTYVDFTSKVAAARKTTQEKIDAVAQGRVWSGAQAKEHGLVDTLGHLETAIASAARRAQLGDKPRVVYIEREVGRFARLLGLLNAEVAGWVGARLDAGIGELGVPPSLARDALRELGWVRAMVDQGKPFATVIHCLCGPAH